MENENRRAEDAERLPAEELEWDQEALDRVKAGPTAARLEFSASRQPAAPAVDAAELDKLKTRAEAATPIETDLYGDRYMQGPYSRADLTAAQDAFVTVAQPAAILRIAALVSELETENDRLRMALADKVMAQTMLHELCVKDGGINMRYSGGAAQLLAEAFGEQFESSGATNYLEVGFNTSNGVRLLVTLQRCDGKTPATFRAEAEALVAQQAARIAELEAREAVLFCGREVYTELDVKAHARTSSDNVSDVLDAAVRLMRRKSKEGK